MLRIDGHADILYRMETESLDFYQDTDTLHLNYNRIVQGGIDLQFFVLWPGSRMTAAEQLKSILAMIDMFYEDVCSPGKIQPILSKSDLVRNLANGQRSGLLSIEGGDCLQGDIRILRRLYAQGVRAMGLTWNPGNCIANGVNDPEDHGLTAFGRDVVAEMNRLGMVVDVAHVAEKGFWDVIEVANAPVINSHANARALCDHRRNLTDDQLKAVFQTGGVVGVTFVPHFIKSEGEVAIADLMCHIDRMLTLGGEDHIGIGSDFDGIERTPLDLRHGGDLPRLEEALVKAYGDRVASKIMGANFKRVLESILHD